MKLSVIMPCYNASDTLRRAFDSIVLQEGVEEFEIVFIDDASTDDTKQIVDEYSSYLPIRYFLNEENSGNAYSFYRGLQEAQGDYFCVLDGDDYYSIPNKLSRQVEFLDSDTREEYVGTATFFVIDFGGRNVHVPKRTNVKEFNYSDVLLRQAGYYHTSTYMYRNIFRGNVPDYFKMKLYRGDTPRTVFHLMYSGKKIRVLDFVGSVYSYTLKGIWSEKDEADHYKYQVDFYKQHRELVQTDVERDAIDKTIQHFEECLKNAGRAKHHYPAVPVDDCLSELRWYAHKFYAEKKDYFFREIYCSTYIDTLCATLGYVKRANSPRLVQTEVNKNNIAIVINALNPGNGGIFNEVVELFEMYKDHAIYVFRTDKGGLSQREAEEHFKSCKNVTFIYPPSKAKSKLEWLSTKMAEIAPYRTYYYCSHVDSMAQALMSKSASENICIFSFDHGYICGLSNPYIDYYIAKRPTDYYLLEKRFGKKVLYIPTWSKGARGCSDLRYEAFGDHQELITASGAARFYKVDGSAPYKYSDFIVHLLEATGGVHYHYGPIPEESLKKIHKELDALKVSRNNFIHVEWCDNIPRHLLQNNVDIFIEPFPTVSYKITLEVLSCGVPIIAQRATKRMSTTDFVPQDMPTWKSREDFIETLVNIEPDELQRLSHEAKEYFKTTHEISAVRPAIRELRPFPTPEYVYFPDNEIHDITEYFDLIGIGKIDVNARVLSKLVKEINSVKKSASFRLGYRFSDKKKSGSGASYLKNLYDMTAQEFVTYYGKKEAERLLESVKDDRAIKFFRMIVSPLRGIKRITKGQ